MSFSKRNLVRLQHLSDETISRLIAGELPTVRAFRARSHIEKCWRCRARREAFENAAMQITEHRNRLVERIPTSPGRRAALLDELRHRAETHLPQPMWVRLFSNFRMRVAKQMNPLFASAVIVTVAACLLFWVWQRGANRVTAAELLQRAEASDAVQSQAAGALYQKVRITTPHAEVDRELYRDPRGVRQHRREAVKPEDGPVQQTLASAGVDWDAPLSASSYQEWHDRQASVSDKVEREDGGLLRLVSTVTDDRIESESLTVRMSDFHPVERTIETRTEGTFEIAELHYAVLPWSGVSDALFEPLQPVIAHPSLRLPALPTETELDSAELGARLVLNKLHADEGEQITVVRTDRAIEVKGVVETDARKQEIVRNLWPLPRVKAEVLSMAELAALPRNRDDARSVTMQSVDVQASPLQRFLDSRGGSKTDLSDSSDQLLDAALKVRQNVGELETLSAKFPVSSTSSANASVLAQLQTSYWGRIRVAIDREVATLDALGFTRGQAESPEDGHLDLSGEAERNEALCRELIAGSNGTGRPARQIVADMYQSANRIRMALAQSSSPEQQQ
jgi:hypothetical protein